MKGQGKDIDALLKERDNAASQLADAENRVKHLRRLVERYDKDLKASGYIPPKRKLHFDDMGGLSYDPSMRIRPADLFLLILKRVGRWMPDEELFQRAEFIGVPEKRAGNFRRSLA